MINDIYMIYDIYNIFPSFPHFRDTKRQMEVE